MLNKLCILILSLSIAFLTACSTSPTSTPPKDITPDFYKNTKEVLTNYNTLIKDGKVLTDEQERKIDFYFNNYNGRSDLTSKEHDIYLEMLQVKANANLYNIAYKKGNVDDKIGYTKAYLSHSDKVEQMLK